MEKEKIRNELIAVFEETMDCKFRKKHYASDMEEMLKENTLIFSVRRWSSARNRKR